MSNNDKVIQILNDTLQRASEKGITLETKRSLEFFNDYVNKNLLGINTLMKLKEHKIVQPVIPKRSDIKISEMITFLYQPKHADTLQYYDRSPLIIPMAIESDHIVGFNLHYLPPVLRVRLMTILFRAEKTSHIAYLKVLAQSDYFKACVKTYLYSHFRSKIYKFEKKHWEFAVFLPLAHFAKAPQNKVFADTRKTVSNRKRKPK